MSETNLEVALLKHLAAMTSAIATAMPNAKFVPPAPTTPWQRATLLRAQNRRSGQGTTSPVFRSGTLSVQLFYPLGAGDKDILLQAQAIQAQFARGLSLSEGGTTVRIAETPSVLPAAPEAGWHTLAVHIPYYSYDQA